MPDELEEIITDFITEAEESLDRIDPLFIELEAKGGRPEKAEQFDHKRCFTSSEVWHAVVTNVIDGPWADSQRIDLRHC